MAITRSICFYAGRKNVQKLGFFGKYYDYEFSNDIAYCEDISFVDGSNELRKFMKDNNIKIGYCDISCDFGGGYSLLKRYTFVNKSGSFITKKEKYEY